MRFTACFSRDYVKLWSNGSPNRHVESHVARLRRLIEGWSDDQDLRVLQRLLTKARQRQRGTAQGSSGTSRLKLKDNPSLLVSPTGARLLRGDDKANLLCDLFERAYLRAPPVAPLSTGVLMADGTHI